jgi:hypothetical protein
VRTRSSDPLAAVAERSRTRSMQSRPMPQMTRPGIQLIVFLSSSIFIAFLQVSTADARAFSDRDHFK